MLVKISSIIAVFGRSESYEAKANISPVFREGPLLLEPSLVEDDSNISARFPFSKFF